MNLKGIVFGYGKFIMGLRIIQLIQKISGSLIYNTEVFVAALLGTNLFANGLAC